MDQLAVAIALRPLLWHLIHDDIGARDAVLNASRYVLIVLGILRWIVPCVPFVIRAGLLV